MLADRNASTHEYDEKVAIAVVRHIQSQYIFAIDALYDKLSKLS